MMRGTGCSRRRKVLRSYEEGATPLEEANACEHRSSKKGKSHYELDSMLACESLNVLFWIAPIT